MESRAAIAAENHKKGYNCAQSVACAYCDLVGVDEKTMFRLTEGFGLGMGNMEGTCGAISAACLLAGMMSSTANLDKPDSKKETYKLSKAMLDAFREKAGDVTCKAIKGVETGVVLHACSDCITDAARIAEAVLFTQEDA